MGDDASSRLQRLEESLGFTQHESATQADELRELSRQVYELTQRTERLERRLRDALERLPPPEGDPDAVEPTSDEQ